MEKNTMVNSKEIRKMEKEFINAQMGKHMKESLKMTKEMEEEFTNGIMVIHMTESGKMES